MADIRYACDGAGKRYGCGKSVAFVARHESEDAASEFVCGIHLAAALAKRGGAWVVTSVIKRK